MNNRNAMNKKILSLIILFLGVFSTIQAQNDGRIRVKGVVLDETTRQPIAFANIGIIGTAGRGGFGYGWVCLNWLFAENWRFT